MNARRTAPPSSARVAFHHSSLQTPRLVHSQSEPLMANILLEDCVTKASSHDDHLRVLVPAILAFKIAV
jgi:hypothetical protein